MNNQLNDIEKKARMWGGTASLLSLVVLFCVLYFCGLYRPFPPPPEYGMEVNLGYSDEGMGNLQSYDPMASPVEQPPVPVASSEEEVVTTSDEEAPSIPRVSEKPRQNQRVERKPQEEVRKVEEKAKEPELNPMALYPGKRKGTENSSQGETGKPGDQGKPNGDVNAKGYEGSGGSGGISFSLNGRSLTSLVKPQYNSEEEGVVVVRIWVNRGGQVTRVQAGVKGTTTMDQSLWRTAADAARSSRFAPKESAPEEQVGTITYRFMRGL